MTQNYYQTTKPLESILGERIEFNRTNASLIVDVVSSVVEKYKKKQEDIEEGKRAEKDRLASAGNRLATLIDCFKCFTKKEILSTDALWNCPKCKEMRRASKKIDLWVLPKVLIVQLKRFNYTLDHRDKIDLFIHFPLLDLDLSQFVLNPAEKSKAKYDLIAVSNHIGGLRDGHYTAHAKNVNYRTWYTFDDSVVSNVNEVNIIISKAAYILVYQQKEQPIQQQLLGKGFRKK
jgi:ubiquitin C-terminal hydrolase